MPDLQNEGDEPDDDPQFQRIDAIVGRHQDEPFTRQVERYYHHPRSALTLPCEVTGIEDFKWEEFYILGPGDPREYRRLRRTQPSYQDRYHLLEIRHGVVSDWGLCFDDIEARVKRTSDSTEFSLGLSELKLVDVESSSYGVLDDYAVFFANYR